MIFIALMASVAVSMADFSWRFDQSTNTVTGAPDEDSIAWSLNTTAGTVGTSTSSDDAGFNDWVALSGSGTANDTFSMSMEAGFGFDPSSPSYSTTDYSGTQNGPTNNTFRFRFNAGVSQGVSPLGQGVGFSGAQSGIVDSEIIHFTISGLDAGQSFVLKSFEVRDNNGDRIDLYYGAGLTMVDTTTFTTDVSSLNIILGNGDQFGFGYDRDTGNRSAFKGMTFDVVPEPGSISLIAAACAGLLLARKKKRKF